MVATAASCSHVYYDVFTGNFYTPGKSKSERLRELDGDIKSKEEALSSSARAGYSYSYIYDRKQLNDLKDERRRLGRSAALKD